jgi:hypothetical protein
MKRRSGENNKERLTLTLKVAQKSELPSLQLRLVEAWSHSGKVSHRPIGVSGVLGVERPNRPRRRGRRRPPRPRRRRRRPRPRPRGRGRGRGRGRLFFGIPNRRTTTTTRARTRTIGARKS